MKRHRHEWGKWELIKTSQDVYGGYYGDTYVRTIEAEVQRRKCETCGEIQEKGLK